MRGPDPWVEKMPNPVGCPVQSWGDRMQALYFPRMMHDDGRLIGSIPVTILGRCHNGAGAAESFAAGVGTLVRIADSTRQIA